MLFANRIKSNKFRLGQILLDAGIISPDVLTHGLNIARQAAMPLGRVLVMSGHVSDLSVDLAVETQACIRDGAIDVKIAFELLRYAHGRQISINEAYRRHGIGRNLGSLSRIGKLLLAAGLVDEAGLHCALRHSQNTAYPLGNALVSLQLVSESTLLNCINLQLLIRDEVVNFLEAVRVLTRIERKGYSIEAALREIGIKFQGFRSTPRIGELLVEAELVCRGDRLVLLEIAGESDRLIGELMSEFHLVSPVVIDAALKIQSLFDNPSFTKASAIRLLKLVNTMNLPLERVLAELDVMDQVVTLLRVSGVIDDRRIDEAKNSIGDRGESLTEALIKSGIIERELFQSGMQCLHHIQTGRMTYEEAIRTLTQGRSSPVYPQEAA